MVNCSNKIIILKHHYYLLEFSSQNGLIYTRNERYFNRNTVGNGTHYENYCFERTISLSFSLSFIRGIDIQNSCRHLNVVCFFWFFILIITSYTHRKDSVLQLICVNGCWLPKFSFVKCLIFNQSHDHQAFGCICLDSHLTTTFMLFQIYLNFQLSNKLKSFSLKFFRCSYFARWEFKLYTVMFYEWISSFVHLQMRCIKARILISFSIGHILYSGRKILI